MPRYQLQVDVPAGTDEGGAVTDTIDVEEQVIEEGFRFAAPGSNGVVHAELRFGDRSLLPIGDSSTVVIPDAVNPAPINVQLPGVPNDIELRAWAPNSHFAHTVTAQFDAVATENAVETVRLVDDGTDGAVVSADASPAPED